MKRHTVTAEAVLGFKGSGFWQTTLNQKLDPEYTKQCSIDPELQTLNPPVQIFEGQYVVCVSCNFGPSCTRKHDIVVSCSWVAVFSGMSLSKVQLLDPSSFGADLNLKLNQKLNR